MFSSERKTKIKLAGKVFQYGVDYFHALDFVQLMPVMLGKSVDPLGPDPNSSVLKIPEIEYQGETLRTVTSMIFHKQVAIKEFGKIFVMSPNIRLERPERKDTGRHLFEFTQLDFEIVNGKMEDVFTLVENYLTGLSQYIKKECTNEFEELGIDVFMFQKQFMRYTTSELIDKYGQDWEPSASLEAKQPFWAISHKREFYDKEDLEKPGSYLNYDMIYPLGFGEGLSGGEREHDYTRICSKIKHDKIDMAPYETYLSFAKQGLMPSAGGGIGMERLTRFITGSNHVSDVCMFKRVPGMPIDI